MDMHNGHQMMGLPTHEDPSTPTDKGKGPSKVLNRVPRACNACRKQKMRCEGADNPPCKRCKHAGLECLFEKPSREATLTGEAGLERIRSLESHVANISTSQVSIHQCLAEIVSHMRNGGLQISGSEGPLSPSSLHGPPSSGYSQSTPVMGHAHPPRGSVSGGPYPRPVHRPSETVSTLNPPTTWGPAYNYNPSQGYNVSYPPEAPPAAYPGRTTAMMSDDSDEDEDDQAKKDQPYKQPWEWVRYQQQNANSGRMETDESSENLSRQSSMGNLQRPLKRKRPNNTAQPSNTMFDDVVTRGIVTEREAKQAMDLYFAECNIFLPAFNKEHDNFDDLRRRSPFAFNALVMIGLKCLQGQASEKYRDVWHCVQTAACATLFAPVTNHEAVQAMLVVSGWSDNGWLSGGHTVRMALELPLATAWPKLWRRIKSESAVKSDLDQELMSKVRTWFTLYLFEHQLSYGAGRPAMLRDDESIWGARDIIRHPLAILDDVRLASTVELMAIRERTTGKLAQTLNKPIDELTFRILDEADMEFDLWHNTWDKELAHQWEGKSTEQNDVQATFYRQSLQLQKIHAELFHKATALRGINHADDVERMSPQHLELARRTIQVARQGLINTITMAGYRRSLKYAVHYTHAAACFNASFLLRLAKLFPNEVNLSEVQNHVEQLAELMQEVPGQRYVLTLQLMLRRSKRRKSISMSPQSNTPLQVRTNVPIDPALRMQPLHSAGPSSSATYPYPYQPQQTQMQGMMGQPSYIPRENWNEDDVLRELAHLPAERVPFWASDSNAVGSSVPAGAIPLDSYLLPNFYGMKDMDPPPRVF